MGAEVRFWVPGIPAPGGSKRGFVNKKSGKVVLMDMGGERTKSWREAVRVFGYQAMSGREPLSGPLRLELRFFMPRPKAHFGTGKRAEILRPDAPAWHTNAPDTTKLIRSTEDALKGVVWRDDCQVAVQFAEKTYGTQTGAQITVTLLGA